MTALADHDGEHITSDNLAASVKAHETLVRLILSKLVRSGLVKASRGRRGSTSIARAANKISILEIYRAVDPPPVFSIHTYPKSKTCRASSSHKELMKEVLTDAQKAFEDTLAKRMLSELVEKARRAG